MAILDERLRQFIEMLMEIGMDWLAVELIDGVRRGRESTETEETLALAREMTQTGRAKSPRAEQSRHIDGVGFEMQPILGDAQLEWAVQYVEQRLQAILAEVAASFDALDAIIASESDTRLEGPPGHSVLVLLSPDEEHKIDRNLVKEAQDHLPMLQQSLKDWLTDTQSGQDRDDH